MLLLLVWPAVAAMFLFVIDPHAPVTLAVTGAVLGAVAGLMQHWSFMQATDGFSAASNLLEIRRAFTNTVWGTRYIRFLYFCKFALLALSFVIVRQPILGVFYGYIAGYFSLMFVREAVTLRDTFHLHHLATLADRGTPRAA